MRHFFRKVGADFTCPPEPSAVDDGMPSFHGDPVFWPRHAVAAHGRGGHFFSRFGLPALIGFLALGMVAGSDGPGAIGFDNYPLAQMIGVACLVFILFSGGLDTNWKLV